MSGRPSWFDRRLSVAATSSSAKNALPSDRRAMESTRDGPQLIARDHADHLDELIALEPGQVDPVDPRLAFGLGQPAGQRMTAVQLVAAEGRDDEQALVPAGAGEEGKQVAGRAVGPVRVLDDEQDRVGRRRDGRGAAECPRRSGPGASRPGWTGSGRDRARSRARERAAPARTGWPRLPPRSAPARPRATGRAVPRRSGRTAILRRRPRPSRPGGRASRGRPAVRQARPRGGSCRRPPRHR